MCSGCRVTVGGETRYACVDGPDFDGHLVDFDEAIRRSQMYKEEEKLEHDCNMLSMGEILMALILTKTPMREQDPKERRNNFKEVALGYNLEEAVQEAKRCIQCKKPSCVPGCPVNVQIPQFISALSRKCGESP